MKTQQQTAKSKVPSWDACRDYRIVGGDTRFTITADTRSRNPQYSIPENETYVLFDVDDDGYETYVQLVNGIMTSDYYTISPDGNITALRDKISEDDFDGIATNSNVTMANNLTNFNDEMFYVYEKVDGEIKLLKITQEEIIHDGYKTLEVTVYDVNTGNTIPYEDILSN